MEVLLLDPLRGLGRGQLGQGFGANLTMVLPGLSGLLWIMN